MMGDPLQAVVGPDRYPLAGDALIDPQLAAKRTLAAYLRRLTFTVRAGADCKEGRFRLNEVFFSWPTPDQELPYPCASIDDQVVRWEEHSLVPTMLEDTFDCYGSGTVLWKTDEASSELQVDFWCTTEAARKAVRAGLPRAFSPTEGRSGVLLRGDPDYFDRSVRCTYLGAEDVNTSDTAFENERRLRATIRADLDVVHLRSVTPLQLSTPTEFVDNS